MTLHSRTTKIAAAEHGQDVVDSMEYYRRNPDGGDGVPTEPIEDMCHMLISNKRNIVNCCAETVKT